MQLKLSRRRHGGLIHLVSGIWFASDEWSSVCIQDPDRQAHLLDGPDEPITTQPTCLQCLGSAWTKWPWLA